MREEDGQLMCERERVVRWGRQGWGREKMEGEKMAEVEGGRERCRCVRWMGMLSWKGLLVRGQKVEWWAMSVRDTQLRLE
jgi:hypothetical protein